jgi:glutamate 5-kinase
MRIVFKFGSGILANPKGNNLERKQFQRLTREVAAQVKAGHECIVVSSGAVAAGLDALGFKERPEDLASRQACAWMRWGSRSARRIWRAGRRVRRWGRRS